MICSYMPESIAEPCEEFVQTYGDEIITQIIQMEMDPDQVCSQLGLCSTASKCTKRRNFFDIYL